MDIIFNYTEKLFISNWITKQILFFLQASQFILKIINLNLSSFSTL